jgi:uncharacterized protein YndB with AHSA1/START domain
MPSPMPAQTTPAAAKAGPHIVRVTRRLDASPERVFDAWTKVEIARQWMFMTPESQPTRRVSLDVRPGGRWNVTDIRATATGFEEVEHRGEYVEIVRPRRLVFTFGVAKFAPRVDRVTIELEPTGTGCLLTLTQEGAPADMIAAFEQGWTKMFAWLDTAVA